MSLKVELTNLIQSYYPDYCPFDVIEKKTKELGYRQSNSERRLRPSESPFIKEIKNDRGYVVGYQWVKPELPKIEPKMRQGYLIDPARHI